MITTGSKKESRIPLTICMAVFIITFFLNGDFEIRYVYNFAFVTAFIVCGFLFDGKLYFNKVVFAYFILAFVVVVFSFLPNSVKDPESNNHAIAIFLFFMCAAMSMPSGKELKKTKTLLIAAAVVFSAYIMFVKIYPAFYWNRIYPLFPPKTQLNAAKLMKVDHYGVPVGGSMVFVDYVIAVALFLCFGRVLSGESSKRERILVYILSALFFVAMVVENRRGELLATVVSLLLMMILCADRRYIPTRKIKRVIFLFVLVVVIISIMASMGMLERYLDMLSGFGSNNKERIEELGNGRMALWREAIRLFRESPLLGIGWNQFRAKNLIPGMEGINVHNDYLQWLCETGIIGFCLILIPTLYIWTTVFRKTRQLIKRKDHPCGKARSLALTSLGIQSFFMILHFFDPCFTKFLYWTIYSLSIVLYNASLCDDDASERSLYTFVLH